MLKRFMQAPIRYRLPMVIASALITSLLASSYFFYVEFKNVTAQTVKSSTISIENYAKGNLEAWIGRLTKRISGHAVDPNAIEALARLGRLEKNPNSPSYDAVRDTYISNNPNPTGELQHLDRGPDNNPYDAIHASFNPHFRGILERNGYYDLFLITVDGTIAYSVMKEDDFGTSLLDGPYASSGLGEVFLRTLAAEPGTVIFQDFAPYAPSGNQPASFLAQQVIGVTGDLLGVVAVQLPISSLTTALVQNLELEATDELYVMGDDNLTRSESLEPGVLGVFSLVQGLPHIGGDIEGDYLYVDQSTGINGHDVVAMVTPADMLGETWYVVAERDRALAYSALNNFILIVLVFIVVSAAVSVGIGYLAARSIVRPLAQFENAMEEIAHENYDAEISGKFRSDEIGKISNVLESFRQKLIRSRDADAVAEQQRKDQERIVSHLASGLQALSAGDLTAQIEEPFGIEYEMLRTNFNETLHNMADLIEGIVRNADEIRSRAQEMSASSNDLSERTENQAATLEETAAALDELTASVREAANGASEVEGVVRNARSEAEESGKVVAEAVEAMSMIRKSSDEISQIIGVIDDIAFQTNLLSLNAGVEAARAGEAGRGFAVVASEVRALAQRSSDAAKQIKSLINSSSEQVENGVGLVGRTGEALTSIIERVSNIDTLMNGIASGSREQSVGLGEINIGMSQLDQVTQQNAAMVEEATAAATKMNAEAMSLSDMVARFKLDSSKTAKPQDIQMPKFKSVNIEPLAPPRAAIAPQKFEEPTEMVANSGDWKDF